MDSCIQQIKPRLSVIIPVRNGALDISRCLNALENQTVPRKEFEIIVVDDGSNDGTAAAAERYGIRVIRQSARGPAAARNHGAREAYGEIILFTDADCEPLPDWIYEMTLPFADPKIFGVKGAYLSRQRSITARFVQCEYESKYSRMSRFERIDFIDTYSAAFRREQFLSLGGYDETYPNASVEDQEFSFRAAAAGFQMVFKPTALVIHRHARTVLQYIKKKYKIGYWKAKLLRRHPGKAIKDTHTPQTLKLEMALVVLSLFFALLAALSELTFPLVATLIIFLLLTLKPILINGNKDPMIGFLTPFYHFIRGLSLTAGLVAGTITQLRAGNPS